MMGCFSDLHLGGVTPIPPGSAPPLWKSSVSSPRGIQAQEVLSEKEQTQETLINKDAGNCSLYSSYTRLVCSANHIVV